MAPDDYPEEFDDRAEEAQRLRDEWQAEQCDPDSPDYVPPENCGTTDLF